MQCHIGKCWCPGKGAELIISAIVVSNALQVSSNELINTEMRLKSINALAQVVKAQRADVKADYVLGIGGFDLDRVADEVRAVDAQALQVR